MQRLVEVEVEHLNGDIRVLSELIERARDEHAGSSFISELWQRISQHRSCVSNLRVLIDGEPWCEPYQAQLAVAQIALMHLEHQAKSLASGRLRLRILQADCQTTLQ